MLNRCVQSFLCFKVASFSNGLCRFFPQQLVEKKNYWNSQIFFFYFFSPTYWKGEQGTWNYQYFSQVLPFIDTQLNLMVERICCFEMGSCSTLQFSSSCLCHLWSYLLVAFGERWRVSVQGLREGDRRLLVCFCSRNPYLNDTGNKLFCFLFAFG